MSELENYTIASAAGNTDRRFIISCRKGALWRSGMIQCSPKHTESLIWIVYRGVIISCRKGALCRSGMIQCSPKHTESLIRIVYRGVIISCRKRRAVPKRYDSMFSETHRISDSDCVSWGYYIMSQRRAVPKRYDSMFSETHRISDSDCVSWGYYIMSQKARCAEAV